MVFGISYLAEYFDEKEVRDIDKPSWKEAYKKFGDECDEKLSKRTADNWLAEMKRCKAIVFVKQGTWEKNLQIFESDVE